MGRQRVNLEEGTNDEEKISTWYSGFRAQAPRLFADTKDGERKADRSGRNRAEDQTAGNRGKRESARAVTRAPANHREHASPRRRCPRDSRGRGAFVPGRALHLDSPVPAFGSALPVRLRRIHAAYAASRVASHDGGVVGERADVLGAGTRICAPRLASLERYVSRDRRGHGSRVARTTSGMAGVPAHRDLQLDRCRLRFTSSPLPPPTSHLPPLTFDLPPMSQQSSCLALALIALAACSTQQTAQNNRDTMTQRQKDSVLGQSGIPGAQGVTKAMRAADSAKAHQAQVDSISP
jgi:hypothetical protein